MQWLPDPHVGICLTPVAATADNTNGGFPIQVNQAWFHNPFQRIKTLIRQDKAEAQFRLGLSEEAAELIRVLSPAQIMKIASGNMLLCRFRVDDDMVWQLLTNHTVSKVDNDGTTKLHASILMAGRYSEAI
jgi:flagellar transcriptional activator FlhD